MTDPFVSQLRRRADSAVPPSTLDLDAVLRSSRRSLHRRRVTGAAGTVTVVGATAALAVAGLPLVGPSSSVPPSTLAPASAPATTSPSTTAPSSTSPSDAASPDATPTTFPEPPMTSPSPRPAEDAPDPSGVLVWHPTSIEPAVPPVLSTTSVVTPGVPVTTQVAPGIVATVTPGVVAAGDVAWLADLGLGDDQTKDAASTPADPGPGHRFGIDVSWFDDDALLVRLAQAPAPELPADASAQAREDASVELLSSMRSATVPALATSTGASADGTPATMMGVIAMDQIVPGRTGALLWGATTQDVEDLLLFDLGEGEQDVRVPVFSLDGADEYRFFAVRTDGSLGLLPEDTTPEGQGVPNIP